VAPLRSVGALLGKPRLDVAMDTELSERGPVDPESRDETGAFPVRPTVVDRVPKGGSE